MNGGRCIVDAVFDNPKIKTPGNLTLGLHFPFGRALLRELHHRSFLNNLCTCWSAHHPVFHKECWVTKPQVQNHYNLNRR